MVLRYLVGYILKNRHFSWDPGRAPSSVDGFPRRPCFRLLTSAAKPERWTRCAELIPFLEHERDDVRLIKGRRMRAPGVPGVIFLRTGMHRWQITAPYRRDFR